jgi:hypothetical protein
MSRLLYVSFWGTSKGWWDRLDLLFDSLAKDFEVYDVGFLHNHAFNIVIKKIIMLIMLDLSLDLKS